MHFHLPNSLITMKSFASLGPVVEGCFTALFRATVYRGLTVWRALHRCPASVTPVIPTSTLWIMDEVSGTQLCLRTHRTQTPELLLWDSREYSLHTLVFESDCALATLLSNCATLHQLLYLSVTCFLIIKWGWWQKWTSPHSIVAWTKWYDYGAFRRVSGIC